MVGHAASKPSHSVAVKHACFRVGVIVCAFTSTFISTCYSHHRLYRRYGSLGISINISKLLLRTYLPYNYSLRESTYHFLKHTQPPSSYTTRRYQDSYQQKHQRILEPIHHVFVQRNRSPLVRSRCRMGRPQRRLCHRPRNCRHDLPCTAGLRPGSPIFLL